MRLWWHIRFWLIATAVFLVVITIDSMTRRPDGLQARIVRVVDGDTVIARYNGERRRVRLIGVDTPETVKRGSPVECYGPQASRATKRRLTGQRVLLVYDSIQRDRYGRTLAFLELRGEDHGAWLLRNGYAKTMYVGDNQGRRIRYSAIQLIARIKHRGLWGEC